MIKVAHLVRKYIDPSETFIINQIRTLKNGGIFEPVVYCHKLTDSSNNGINPILISRDFSTLDKKVTNFLYNNFRIFSNKSVNKIIDYIKQEQIMIIHLHYLVDARFFIKVLKKSGLPSVVSVYGYDVSAVPKLAFGLGMQYIYPIFNSADYFLSMSEDMKKDLIAIGCPESKIIVHYHGINTTRFKYPDRNYSVKNRPVKILFCGMLTYKKAPQVLLKAIRIIKKKNLTNIPFELNIMGEGPLRNEIEKLIKEFELQNIVHLLGHIPHESEVLINQYKSADIFVLPSMIAKNDKEGIPGTLIEAMASGLPVISSYHAGIPEIITSGKNGLLIREGDFEELSEKLSYLINNISVRYKLGQEALATTINLNLKIKTSELESIYEEINKKMNK